MDLFLSPILHRMHERRKCKPPQSLRDDGTEAMNLRMHAGGFVPKAQVSLALHHKTRTTTPKQEEARGQWAATLEGQSPMDKTTTPLNKGPRKPDLSGEQLLQRYTATASNLTDVSFKIGLI